MIDEAGAPPPFAPVVRTENFIRFERVRESHNRTFGVAFKARVGAMGIRDRPTSFRLPWQNGYIERLIGSIRRECTDHLIVFNAEHLGRILTNYAAYYNQMRTHVSLGRTRPAHDRSTGSETLSHVRFLAGSTID